MASFTLSSDTITQSILSHAQHSKAALRGPLVLALAYYLGAEFAFFVGTLSDQIFALFWPPNVILFCALMITPQREWWRYVAAAFPAHVVAELGVGMPLPQLLVAFATNCMVALINAYAVRRFLGGPPWFGNFRKASIYIVITAGAGPAISALGGAFVPILGGGTFANYWIFWSHWYLANALPNLTLGQVFLIWFSAEAGPRRWKLSRQHIEPASLALALLSVCVVAAMAARFSTSSFLPIVLLLPLPVVLWAAVRFGEKGASGAILIVAVVWTWATLHGRGLFPGEDPERGVIALQLFLTGLSIPVLMLGALIDELRSAERTTRVLAASLVRAQDEERRRIARDLHDSTGQKLIAATLIAGRIEKMLPPAAQPTLQKLEDMLQQSIGEVRTVSYLLHPPLLDEAGLGLALRHYVEGFMERRGIAVDLELSQDVDRLPPDTELVLFRVVQEALTNISRHSGSRTAQIRVALRGATRRRQVRLTIIDAGRGMPGVGNPVGRTGGSDVTRGVGLTSMRERLHQIGGRLDIDSTVGGTTLTAVVPIGDHTRAVRPDRSRS